MATAVAKSKPIASSAAENPLGCGHRGSGLRRPGSRRPVAATGCCASRGPEPAGRTRDSGLQPCRCQELRQRPQRTEPRILGHDGLHLAEIIPESQGRSASDRRYQSARCAPPHTIAGNILSNPCPIHPLEARLPSRAIVFRPPPRVTALHLCGLRVSPHPTHHADGQLVGPPFVGAHPAAATGARLPQPPRAPGPAGAGEVVAPSTSPAQPGDPLHPTLGGCHRGQPSLCDPSPSANSILLTSGAAGAGIGASAVAQVDSSDVEGTRLRVRGS